MTERYEIDTLPPDHVRLPVCEWLRRHGINPDDVAVPGWIERQTDLYRLAYEGYICDDQGNILINKARDAAQRRSTYVQLEGPPLPWPTALVEWVADPGEDAA